jgi:hypothetical protein
MDFGLEALLNLHGWSGDVGGGFWVSVRAVRVTPDAQRPHGIGYSLTLHRPDGERVLGYDNAHPPGIGSGPARKSRRRGRPRDHRHYRGRVGWYEFKSAVKLMEDFWKDVEVVLEEEDVPWTE